MNLNDCYNFDDFRKLAKKKLPAPIFHYIDGAGNFFLASFLKSLKL